MIYTDMYMNGITKNHDGHKGLGSHNNLIGQAIKDFNEAKVDYVYRTT